MVMPCMSYDKLQTIEPAYHPKSKMGFLIDWLITLKCNYDCSYCGIGIFGHDNSLPHPDYEKSLRMLKQLYAYTDVMMISKKQPFKDAIMNMYGGEAIFHPKFVDIAEATTREFEKYSDRWRLRRRITTNGTATVKNWKNIVKHIEGATMSYHSQGSKKLKNLFYKNLEHIIDIKMQYDVVVLMYPHEDHWQDCVEFMQYCKKNKIIARPRLLDGGRGKYNSQQIEDLSEFLNKEELKSILPGENVDGQVRACCGGRPLCTNRDLKTPQRLVPRGPAGYRGWKCSASQFFIFGNNVNGQYFTNKDCHVRLDQTRGPIATIHTMDDYTDTMRKQVNNGSGPPILTCVQDECLCGTCAPKSRSLESLQDIMKIYNTTKR